MSHPPYILHMAHKVSPHENGDKYIRFLYLKVFIFSYDKPEVSWFWNSNYIDGFITKFQHDLTNESNKIWVTQLDDFCLKNRHGGILFINVKNNQGIGAVQINLDLEGFDPPLAVRSPFQFFSNHGTERIIGIKLKNVTDGEYETRWFKDGVEIENKDNLFKISNRPLNFQGCYACLQIKNVEKAIGNYKAIVKNSSGELQCEFSIKNEIVKPYLRDSIYANCEFHAAPERGRREAVLVKIHVPFASSAAKHLIRWSLDRPLTEKSKKFEGYEQTLDQERWNTYTARLKFLIQSNAEPDVRRYRCEVFNEEGKLESFALIRVHGIDDDLTGKSPLIESKCDSVMKTEENDKFYELSTEIYPRQYKSSLS